METIIQILIMAILVESIWETLKMVWQDKKVSIDRIGALVVGQLISWAIGIDIFVLVQLKPKVQYIGIIALGILISRGSNYIHDIVRKLVETKLIKEG